METSETNRMNPVDLKVGQLVHRAPHGIKLVSEIVNGRVLLEDPHPRAYYSRQPSISRRWSNFLYRGSAEWKWLTRKA